MSQEYRVDFHVHTEASPDGLSSPEELAAAAKRAGLHGIAIADHNCFSLSEERVIDGVRLLPACECSTDAGHILALFCDRPFPVWQSGSGALPGASDVIAAIHRAGGLAVIAHPFERRDRDLSALAALLDGVETENSRAWMRNPEANRMAAAYAAACRLPQLGGSDAHSAKAVGNAYTVLRAASEKDWKHAVQEGSCSAAAVRQTTRLQKGFSQLRKAKKSGSPTLVLRGLLYVGWCWCQDRFHK